MIDFRAAPRSTSGPRRVVSRRFASAVEAAVAKYAPKIWEGVLAAYLKRLRAILEALRPTLDRMVLPEAQARAFNPYSDPAVAHIESLIHQVAQGLKDPDLTQYAEGLASDMVFDRGLLATDQRLSTMLAEASRLIESGLFTYWRNLNAPPYIARKIYEAKAAGLSGQPLYNQLASEFRTGFYSAERLVRTLYTGGSNAATWQGLKASGFTGMEWISSHDSRVRPRKGGDPKYNHRRMDGMVVPIGGVFHSHTSGASLRWPGDASQGAPGGEIYNCRCTIRGVMLEEGEKPTPTQANIPLEPDPTGAKGKEIEAWKAQVLATIDRLQRDQAEIDSLAKQIADLTAKRRSMNYDRAMTEEQRKAYWDEVHRLNDARTPLIDRREELLKGVRAGVHEALKSPRGAAQAKVLAPRNRNNRERTDAAVQWLKETLGPGLIDGEIGGYGMQPPKFNAPKGLGRAFYQEADQTVNFSAHDGVRTIVHEVGHWIEWNLGRYRKDNGYPGQPIQKAAQEFLHSRVENEPTQRLKDIFPGMGYGSHEVARPDKFLDPYVGKIYTSGSTEIVSMGLEHLYADPVNFFNQDRGHFEFILEVIALNRRGIP